MKMLLQNTSHGLIPLYDQDYEEKRKLKIGDVYSCEVKKARNIKLHRMYFALINCAWEYLQEHVQQHFNNNKDGFRKTIEIAAGWYEPVFSLENNCWEHHAKSISFASMTEYEFRDHYENVKNVLFASFLENISYDEFMNELVNF